MTRFPVMWNVVTLGSKLDGPQAQLPSMLSSHVQPAPAGKWKYSAIWQSASFPDVTPPAKSHQPQNPKPKPVDGSTKVPVRAACQVALPYASAGPANAPTAAARTPATPRKKRPVRRGRNL